MPISVFMISRDAAALDPASDTAARLRSYGADTAITVAVLDPARAGSVTLSPTVTVHGFAGGFLARVFRVFRLAFTRVRSDWVVTAQDPFEAGTVAWLVARLRGAALELQLHGDFFGPAWRREAWHRPARLWIAKRLLSRADAVRVPSQRVAASLSSFVSYSCIAAVPVAVPETHVPAQAERDQATVLFAGRFSREKNLPVLLAAFRELRKRIPIAKLVLAGEGPEEERVWKEIVRLGIGSRVRLLPWQRDIGELLGTATVCALPSRHESWGRFAVEAALASCPVVMTDVGCAGELLQDGESAWIVPVGDAQKLAEALLEAMTKRDEASRRAERARTAAMGLPTRERTAAEVVAVWRRIATHRAEED